MCLIALVALTIIAAIVMKITGVGGDKIKLPGPKDNNSNGNPPQNQNVRPLGILHDLERQQICCLYLSLVAAPLNEPFI